MNKIFVNLTHTCQTLKLSSRLAKKEQKERFGAKDTLINAYQMELQSGI